MANKFQSNRTDIKIHGVNQPSKSRIGQRISPYPESNTFWEKAGWSLMSIVVGL